MLRFLHCADLHIDRSFEGVRGLSATIKKQMTTINQRILHKIVDEALANQVDFVLFAGDTFHQSRPSIQVQHHFFQEITRLKTAGIPVYLIFGNHDYYDPQRYWFDFPENVILFSSEAVETVQAIAKNGESYAISGFSYQHSWITENKAADFPNRGAADYHIGLYHGDSNGTQYAPFTLAQLKQKGYDYWALGHVHIPTILCQVPLVVYPGTPQGKTRKEQQSSIVLATLSGKKAEAKAIDVAEFLWQEQEISLAGISNSKEALQVIIKELAHPQNRFVKIFLSELDQLPKDWLIRQEIPEFITFLNEGLAKKKPLQIVYDLALQVEETQKIQIAAPVELRNKVMATYQESTLFQAELAELLSYPGIARLLDNQEFQREVLRAANEILSNEFTWEETT